MVKRNVLLYITALTLMLSACCKSDDESDSASSYSDYFTATISPYGDVTKTYIEVGSGCDYSCWANGDLVNINGTVRAVMVSGDVDSYTATIGADGIAAYNGGFLAAYPGDEASVSNGTATFTIPALSEYRTVTTGAGNGKQVVDAPMVAFTTDRTLQFENAGLLVLFNLKTEGSIPVSLQRITVNCDRPICGNYSMTRQDNSWTPNATGLDGTSRTLVCNDPIALSSTAKPFYLYLPPIVDATTLTVDIHLNIDGVRRHFVKTKSGDIDLDANKRYDFGTLTYNTSAETLTDNNGVSYDEVEPAGTESDPYLIGNTAEWNHWCGKYATSGEKHFRMVDDITVANAIADFRGTLDGDGHTVSLCNCALISHLNGGTVKNISTRADEAITTSNYAVPGTSRVAYGTIAAYATDATLINCINTADISQNASANTFDVGGIVGYVDNPSSTEVDGCRNEGNIDCSSANTTFNIGGIIGTTSRFSTHLINCCNLGRIQHTVNTANTCCIGGLVGLLGGVGNTIENSYSHGEISGVDIDQRGGITSQMGSGGTIQNSYCFSSDATLNLCQINSVNGVIRFCYHYGTNTVSSGNAATNCATLANATTIYRDQPNNLATQLNSNITMLSINHAWLWTEIDNHAALVQPTL